MYFRVKLHYGALLSIFLMIFLGIAWADSLDKSILDFKSKINQDYKNMQAYEDFIGELESAGYLGKGVEVFEVLLPRIITLKENEQAFHRFGIALYSAGHAEEAEHVLRLYSDSRKYTPGQGLALAEAVVAKAAASGSLPAETKQKVEQQLKKSEKIRETSFLGQDIIFLKSGQKIEGTITKKESGGIWLKMDQNSEIFWDNAEIEKIEKVK